MKLSEALEFCIEKKFYGIGGDLYMCHALKAADLRDHIPAVMDMVEAIQPKGYALASALGLDGKGLSSNQAHEICKKHYIKWIAELKEQGL